MTRIVLVLLVMAGFIMPGSAAAPKNPPNPVVVAQTDTAQTPKVKPGQLLLQRRKS